MTLVEKRAKRDWSPHRQTRRRWSTAGRGNVFEKGRNQNTWRYAKKIDVLEEKSSAAGKRGGETEAGRNCMEKRGNAMTGKSTKRGDDRRRTDADGTKELRLNVAKKRGSLSGRSRGGINGISAKYDFGLKGEGI